MKRVKQGNTGWLIGYYPAEYTDTNEHCFYVWQAFVTKSRTTLSNVGTPFNCLSVHVIGVGHYFYGEKSFLNRTFKSKKAATRKAMRIVEHVQWMLDNGKSDSEVKEYVESVIVNKEK